jgi:uncharacterized protein with von Willebrand factor type A (vWA) domain
MSYELYDQPQTEEEINEIDNFRVNFFAFNDHINNTTHLLDAVDNINITNKAQNYNVGTNISQIYDDLVNSNQYKSKESSLCRNITLEN